MLVAHKVHQSVLFSVGVENRLGLQVLYGSKPAVSYQLRSARDDDSSPTGMQRFPSLMIRESHLESPKLNLVLASLSGYFHDLVHVREIRATNKMTSSVLLQVMIPA